MLVECYLAVFYAELHARDRARGFAARLPNQIIETVVSRVYLLSYIPGGENGEFKKIFIRSNNFYNF